MFAAFTDGDTRDQAQYAYIHNPVECCTITASEREAVRICFTSNMEEKRWIEQMIFTNLSSLH